MESHVDSGGSASFGGLAASGASPVVGWLIDRYGARIVLASSVFILGLSTISLAWATMPIAFYLAYGVGRVIFSSPVQIGASVVASRWFIRMRGRASGVLFLSHSIGMIMFPLVASIVIDMHGWRYAWVVLGLIVWAVALLPATLLIAQSPEDVGLRPDGDEAVESDKGSNGSSSDEEPGWTLKAATKTPALWILATGTGLLFLMQAGINTHLGGIPARRRAQPRARGSRGRTQRCVPRTREHCLGLDCRASSRSACPDYGSRGHGARLGPVHDDKLNYPGAGVFGPVRVRARWDALSAASRVCRLLRASLTRNN